MTWDQDIYCFQEVGSTNDEAMKLAESGAVEGTLVVADAQTKGRGRQGRPWHAPAGKGLWFSVVLRPSCGPQEAVPLTQVAAEGVREGVKAATGISLDLKLPNDLLWQSRKVCGILTESSVKGDRLEYVVVGVGVNVNMREEDFPLDIRDLAGSLSLAMGREMARPPLLAAILQHMEGAYESWLQTL